MLEIIGFAALNLLLIGMTLTALIFILDAIGKYNIGGVPNKLAKRSISCLILVALPLPWYLLWVNSPFVIHLRG